MRRTTLWQILKANEYGAVIFEEENSTYSIVVVNKSAINDVAIDEFLTGIKKYALHKFRSLTKTLTREVILN